MLKRICSIICLLGLGFSVSAQEARTGVTRYLVTTDHVKPEMMGPEERAAFFAAGTGLIAPLGQFIHAYEADISF